jgi:hypothetical protein
VNANSAVGGRIRRFFNKDFSDHHGPARSKTKDSSSSVPMPAIYAQKIASEDSREEIQAQARSPHFTQGAKQPILSIRGLSVKSIGSIARFRVNSTRSPPADSNKKRPDLHPDVC